MHGGEGWDKVEWGGVEWSDVHSRLVRCGRMFGWTVLYTFGWSLLLPPVPSARLDHIAVISFVFLTLSYFSLCLPASLSFLSLSFSLSLSVFIAPTHTHTPTPPQVPYTTTVKLKRPIGLHVVEGPAHTVFVQSVKPDLSAARSKRIEVGDQIVAMSASWGDRMWEVTSVESFVVVRW